MWREKTRGVWGNNVGLLYRTRAQIWGAAGIFTSNCAHYRGVKNTQIQYEPMLIQNVSSYPNSSAGSWLLISYLIHGLVDGSRGQGWS